jgi:hypothetical protein
MREILTSYNDTIEGRCAVCLEGFNENSHLKFEKTESFTERFDLIRIDQCFHRFHLICVHRDWFMERAKEKDQYGDVISHSIPECKRCPICRRKVDAEEIDYVSTQFSLHPELEDKGYQY